MQIRVQLRTVLLASGAALAVTLGLLGGDKALAAVTFSGNVTPAPPGAGGNVAAPFLVGDSGTGTLAINGSTVLTVSGGNATVGDDLAAIGIVQVTGLLSTLSTGGDITIGNLGSGSFLADSLARISAADDLFLGVGASSTGALFLQDFGTIANINDTVIVGQGGDGLVQVSSGARINADDAIIGQAADGSGNVTISGFNSLWRQTNAMTVGDAGRGVLQVNAQGQLETTNTVIGATATGIGSVTVTGGGSVWQASGFIHVGSSGQGSLNILDGGRVNSTGVVQMADFAGSEANAIVVGVNSLWNMAAPAGSFSPVTVGEAGTARLQILGGGRINSGNAILGDLGTGRGEVVVDGIGSLWEINGTLDVAEPGESSLTIAGGGVVTTTGVARVGAAGTITFNGGRLSVAAAGGLTNQGLVQGSGRTDGNFVNSAAGEIRTHAGDQLVLGGTLNNAGLVNLDGGEIEVFGATTNSLDIDARNAVLRFNAGLTITSTGALASTGGAVDVFGAVTNNVGGQIVVGGESITVFHDTVTNNGQLFLSPGSDLLMLENLSFSAASSLNLQLSDEEPLEDFDGAAVGGAAMLAGTLGVTLDSGYTPQLGDAFAVLTAAGGVTGTFANENLPNLNDGLSWDVDYTPTSVVLTVVPGGGLLADFNGDGEVNGTDLAFWKTGYGTKPNATKINGDADGDGIVDGTDFLAWQREVGLGGASPAAAAVPEPAAWGLALASIAAAIAGRRRRGLLLS